MKTIENVTCVRFVNHTIEPDFVVVTGGLNACKSKIGRQGGKQVVKLIKPGGNGCFSKGKILHEFVHLLGFHHFQRSPIRDNHINVNWDNVNPESEHKFDMRSSEEMTDFGTGYDYDSIVHPRKTRYSLNNTVTIETVDPKNMDRIGQREKLSDGDILRINRMYKCEAISQNVTDLETESVLNEN